MRTLAWTLLMAVALAGAGRAQMLPRSPCPDLYGYERNAGSGEWLGLISLLTPARYAEVRLEVTLSSSVAVAEDELGELNIRGGEKGAMDATQQVLSSRRHVLMYNIAFPRGKPVPTLLRVTVNGNSLCHSTVPDGSRSQITLSSFLSTGVKTVQTQGQDFEAANTSPAVPPPRPTPDPDLDTFIESVLHPSEEPVEFTDRPTRPTPSPPTRRPARPPTRPPSLFGIDPEEEFEVDQEACGFPTPLPNSLVVNGSPAVRGQWPWQTALFKNEDSKNGPGIHFHCGGTLITRRHIITAAHCVVETKNGRQKVVATNSLVIYFGKHNLKSFTEKGLQTMEPEKIVVHPNYNENLANDLALLLLNGAVEVTQYVKPICLWTGSPDLAPLVEKVGMVAGWGFDESGRISEILRMAPMPVVSQETCIRSDDVFYLKYTSNTTLCAGYRNGTTVCNGDSGSGLVFRMENAHQARKTWFLRGVVSISMLESGEATCSIYSYIVFTDVAKYMPWIHEQLRIRPS